MVMVSWLLMTALAVAEPVGNAGTTTEANTVLTATEIYGLLDDERWSKGTVEARRLLAEDPTSAVAHLTLGDALSHYPNEDGNTFAAFDSWMTAKKLSNTRSSIHKVAEQRLAWALKQTGILKLTPSQFMDSDGFHPQMTVEVFASQQVDWVPRIDRVNGGIYITNIPVGDVVLKIQPAPELPTVVWSGSSAVGSFQKVSVPTTLEGVEGVFSAGTLLSYNKEGRHRIDQMVQELIGKPHVSFHEYSTQMVNLPVAPMPMESVTTFIGSHGEQIVYNNGANQTLVGGQYIVAVEKNGTVTYGDMVVHPDLSAKTLSDFVLQDDQRRDTMIDPSRTVLNKTPSIEHSSAYGHLNAPETSVEEVISTVAEDAQDAVQKESEPESSPVVNNATPTSVNTVDTVPAQSDEPQKTAVDVAVDTTTKSSEEAALPDVNAAEPFDMPELDESDKSDQSERTTDPIVENMPVEVPSGDSATLEWVYDDSRSAKIHKATLIAAGVGTLYTGFSMYRADVFADLANAERKSQSSFNEYQQSSATWERQMLVGGVTTGHLLAFYLGTNVVEWCCIQGGTTEESSVPVLQDLGKESLEKEQ